MLRDKVGSVGQIRDDGFVCRLVDPFVKDQDQGRQKRHAADHTDDHAFGHDHTDVHAEAKVIKPRAAKPAIVVTELPATDLKVLEIA